jgi:redox-sensitive bicupin YhaK (pirin superfamily)
MLSFYRDFQGYPDHPHRGQAIITYMIEGSIKYEDSVGNAGTITAGGALWMTAV